MIRFSLPANEPLYETTRTYPRSLPEAFPSSEGRKDGVEVYLQPSTKWLDRGCFAAAIILLLLMAWACLAIPDSAVASVR